MSATELLPIKKVFCSNV